MGKQVKWLVIMTVLLVGCSADSPTTCTTPPAKWTTTVHHYQGFVTVEFIAPRVGNLVAAGLYYGTAECTRYQIAVGRPRAGGYRIEAFFPWSSDSLVVRGVYWDRRGNEYRSDCR